MMYDVLSPFVMQANQTLAEATSVATKGDVIGREVR